MGNRIGKCPVCDGSGRKPATENDRKWGGSRYDKITDTTTCHNCGTHGMFAGPPDGLVELRKDNGEPCVHEYVEEKIGRCYYRYECKHCGSSYSIDSGD